MPFDAAGWNDWGDDWRPERPVARKRADVSGMAELSGAVAAFWVTLMGAALTCYFVRWLR